MKFVSNKLFDEYTEKYDILSSSDYKDLWDFFKIFLNHEDVMNFLEIGCGSCAFSESMKKRLKNTNFFGIDLSYSIIKWSIFPCTQGMAQYLPYKNNSFDVIAAPASLHHFDDIEKVAEEVYRCQKPGGVFFSYDPNVFHPQRLIFMTAPLRYHFYKHSGDRALSKKKVQTIFTEKGFELLNSRYLCFYNSKASFFNKANYHLHSSLEKTIPFVSPFFASWFVMVFRKMS